MEVVKFIFYIVLIIIVPIAALFIIRLVMKASRALDQLNTTLEDARPQVNMLLSNLNTTLEDVNDEMVRVIEITNEAQEVLAGLEGSIRSVEKAMQSPAARFGGMTLGAITTYLLFGSQVRRARKMIKKSKKSKKEKK